MNVILTLRCIKLNMKMLPFLLHVAVFALAFVRPCFGEEGIMANLNWETGNKIHNLGNKGT